MLFLGGITSGSGSSSKPGRPPRTSLGASPVLTVNTASPGQTPQTQPSPVEGAHPAIGGTPPTTGHNVSPRGESASHGGGVGGVSAPSPQQQPTATTPHATHSPSAPHSTTTEPDTTQHLASGEQNPPYYLCFICRCNIICIINFNIVRILKKYKKFFLQKKDHCSLPNTHVCVKNIECSEIKLMIKHLSQKIKE